MDFLFESLPLRKKIGGIQYIKDKWGNFIPENLECLPTKVPIRIRHPPDCLPLLAKVRGRNQECFVVITLDGVHQVIQLHEITVGLADQTQVHPRETYVCALEDRAVAIVIAHNHPSGSLDPSMDDLLTTRRLADAGRLLGIPLLDHMIVSEAGYCSLKESFPDYFNPGVR